MATSSKVYNLGRGDWFGLSLGISSAKNIAGNYSDVTATLSGILYFGGYYLGIGSRPGTSITIDGQAGSFTAPDIDRSSAGSFALGSVSKRVNHNNDGKKTITVSVSYPIQATIQGTYYNSVSFSATMELDTIPRAHSFSTQGFLIGDGIVLDISKSASAFTTRARVLMDGVALTGWKAISGGGMQYVYYTAAEANSMMAKLPTTTRGTFTLQCQTMNGSTVIATNNLAVYGTVKSDVIPAITSISATETNTAVSGLSLPFVGGVSTIKAAASGVSAGQGSSIESYSWKLDNLSSSATSPTFATISKTAVTLSVTVRDKRGRTASKSISITQLPYAKPSINLFSGARYDAADKTKVNYDLKSSVTSLKAGSTEKNTLQYRITIKRLPEGQESVQKGWTSVSGLSVNLTASSLGTIPHDGDYHLKVEVKDKFSTSKFTFLLKGTRKLAIEVIDGKRVELHLAEGVLLNGSPLGSGSGGSGASEAWAVTYNNATSSLTSTNVQGAIDEIRGLVPTEMPAGFGNDFLELPNGAKDYYDASTGHIHRKVKSFIIDDGDVSLITVASPDWADYKLVTILAAKATDWKWYDVSTSQRPAGSAEIETWEGKTDHSISFGRNSLCSIFVPKALYASTTDARNALRGKKAYYELAASTTEFVGKFSGTAAAVAALTEQVDGIEDRVETLENASTSDDHSVPDYVLGEANRVANLVLQKRTANSFVFGAATDLHIDFENISAPGIKHAGQAMKIIQDRTKLDLVALLGDYVHGYYSGSSAGLPDHETDQDSMTYVRRCFAESGRPTVMLQGNHDALRNDYGNLTKCKQVYYSYIGANNLDGNFDSSNLYRNYGYLDFEKQKMRVVYVNTADLSDVPSGWSGGTTRISKDQYQWMVGNALDMSSKYGWGLIVLSHHPLNDGALSNFHTLLAAVKGKKTGSFVADNTSISYDFSNFPGEFIAHFHGHIHNFRAKEEIDPTYNLGVLSITIPNACYGRNNEYGMTASYPQETKDKFGDVDDQGRQRAFKKTANGKDDTAFNVVIVDRGTRKIHCLNYGAGIDREVSY